MPLKKQSLRSKIQNANSAAFDVPAPTPPVDLHDPNPELGQVHWDPNDMPTRSDPSLTDTRVLQESFSYGADDPKPVNFEWPYHNDEEPTQVFSDRTNQSNDAFAKAKTIEQLAQEDAERALGRKPLQPPVTGTMEGQPVQSTIDRRGADIGRVEGERRVASASAVSTSSPDAQIGDTADDLALNTRQVQDQANRFIFGKSPDPGRVAANEARKAFTPSQPLRQQAEGAIKKVGPRDTEAAMLGERVNPQPTTVRAARSVEATSPVVNAVGTAGKEFTERLGAALGSRQYGKAALELMKSPADVLVDTAKGIAKGLAKPAIETAQSIKAGRAATQASLDALAEKGIARRLVQGGAARAFGAGRAGLSLLGGATEYGKMGARGLGEGAALAFIGRRGQESTTAREAVPEVYREQASAYRREGQKYGFDVTHRPYDDTKLILKALVGADPKIEVHENPSLKARYEQANRKRIRALINSGAIHPIATGRPTISGSSE